MNHQHITEVDLAEQYLMGRLQAEETAEFEAHFVDCKECVDRLETTRALLDGLRVVASERAAQGTGSDTQRQAVWLTRYRLPLAIAAGVILIAIIGLAIYQIRHSRTEAEQAMKASAEWQRRFEDERESRSVAEKQKEDSERTLKTEIAQLRAEIEEDSSGDSPITPRIFTLSSTRSAASSGSINELNLSGRPGDIIISIPLEGETGYADYRITIENDRRQSIWQSGSLKPTVYESLRVRLSSKLFQNGGYTLTVEGTFTNKSTAIIGQYSLRVRKSD